MKDGTLFITRGYDEHNREHWEVCRADGHIYYGHPDYHRRDGNPDPIYTTVETFPTKEAAQAKYPNLEVIIFG